jgi:hypothetical protein
LAICIPVGDVEPLGRCPALRCTEVSQQIDAMGHFRPIDDVCAMSAFRPIATELLHYGK